MYFFFILNILTKYYAKFHGDISNSFQDINFLSYKLHCKTRNLRPKIALN